METVIVNTKNASSAKFILELVQKLGESGKILNVEEKEDFFLGALMNTEKTNTKVSRATIFKKIMEVTFDKSFSKSLDKLNDKIVLKRIEKAILQCEAASELHQIANLKKMVGFQNSTASKLVIIELE